MLKRIYVDNFRSLVNFELNLEKVNLFMGGNGSGKSSVFDVLERVRRLVVHGENAEDLFQEECVTRWDSREQIVIEIDVDGAPHVYRYRIVLGLAFVGVEIREESLIRGPTKIVTRDSHHPEILNMHALDAGIVFRRDSGGPTRVERFTAEPGETLTPAELIARGWYGGAG